MYASIPERYNDERVFIRELWFEPGDLSARLIYADWLEEHRDQRAEILRNDVQLFELGARHDEEAVQQREKLVAQRRRIVHRDHWQWMALVGSAEIEGCTSLDNPELYARTEQSLLQFRVRCPLRWENLQAIGDDPTVRFCSECQRSVHYCMTMQDVQRHARSYRCVAVDASVMREETDDYDSYTTLGVII